MKEDVYDQLERRCPRLGGTIAFSYCRICGEGTSHTCCPKIADCWWEYFDIVTYLKASLPDAAFNELINNEKTSKVTSLVELIEQARSRARNG